MQQGLLKQNRAHRDLMMAYSTGTPPSKHLSQSLLAMIGRGQQVQHEAWRWPVLRQEPLDFPSGRPQVSVQQLVQG